MDEAGKILLDGLFKRVEALEKRVNDHHELGIPAKLKSVEDRVEKVEKTVKEIHDLTRSVDSLARSVETMLKEQQKQQKDIEALKSEPAEQWKTAKKTVITTAVGAVTSAIITALIFIVSNYA
jgi:hypothetical protein